MYKGIRMQIFLPGHKPIRIAKGDFDAVTVSGPVHTLHIKIPRRKKEYRAGVRLPIEAALRKPVQNSSHGNRQNILEG